MTNSDLKAIIIDDSQQARKLLRLILAEVAPHIEVCAEAESLDEAVALMKTHRPKIAFLDIEMPGKSGLQLLEELGQVDFHFEIIFTTAYNQFAINAFRLSAVDYLLKPIDEKQLKEAVLRAEERINTKQIATDLNVLKQNLISSGDEQIRIPSTGGFELIKVNQIMFIKADGAYVHIYCINNKNLTVSKNLKYFENALQGISYMVRPHRSYLVNLNFITRVDKSNSGKIILQNNIEVDISRDRKAMFFDILEKFSF